MMKLPDFLLIGVTKSGTTTLYNALRQHPEIFMGVPKEPNFFCRGEEAPFSSVPETHGIPHTFTRVAHWDAYQALFAERKRDQRCGEASVSYFYIEGSAARVAARLPDAKLILILRDPVERAFSHYLEYCRSGLLPVGLSFEAFYSLESQDINAPILWEQHPQALRAGFYARHFSRWRNCFPVSQMRVYLFEEFIAQPETLLRDLYAFLGVGKEANKSVYVHKRKSGQTRSRRLHQFLTEPHPIKDVLRPILPNRLRRLRYRLINTNLRKPQMAEDMRGRLYQLYAADILALESMLDMDLSAWKYA